MGVQLWELGQRMLRSKGIFSWNCVQSCDTHNMHTYTNIKTENWQQWQITLWDWHVNSLHVRSSFCHHSYRNYRHKSTTTRKGLKGSFTPITPSCMQPLAMFIALVAACTRGLNDFFTFVFVQNGSKNGQSYEHFLLLFFLNSICPKTEFYLE